MNTIVEACDKIADTATAHDRTFLVEVMGRDCGYLAMTSAVAAGADLAVFPERGKPEAKIVEQIVDTVLAVRAKQRRAHKVIIIKAEGVAMPIDKLKTEVDAALRAKAPGADPATIETRVTVLGHVVRGGRPSAFDRLLASRMANVAVRALGDGVTRKMVAWLPPTELDPAVAARSAADPYCWLVDLPAVLDETAKLLSGASARARWRAGVFDQVEHAFQER
jgi:6-phosphofructokinase 1